MAASDKGDEYLRGPDDHANLRGNYLAACCIYVALTRRTPVGNEVTHEDYDLTAAEARLLQEIAWNQYRKRGEEQKRLVATLSVARNSTAPKNVAEIDAMGDVSSDGRYVTYVNWSTGDLALRDTFNGKIDTLQERDLGTWRRNGASIP